MTQAFELIEHHRPHYPVGLIVLMPTRGAISAETFSCFMDDRSSFDGLPYQLRIAARHDVDVARNRLAAGALRLETVPFTADEMFCLWVDDDAFWGSGAVQTAIGIFNRLPQVGILGGSFCPRLEYAAPTAVPKQLQRRSDYEALLRPGNIVEVAWVGFHWVMHRLAVLEQLGPDPFSIIEDLAEDQSFCKRCEGAGIRVYVCTNIVVPHIDALSGDAFIPGMHKLSARVSTIVDPNIDLEAIAAERDYGIAVNGVRRVQAEKAVRR